MSRPTLKAFTPLAAAALATVPFERAIQGSRSYSFSSSTSSTSSAYSRAPEDLVDRLACHQVKLLSVAIVLADDQASTIFQLWSAGNVRIQKLDLTIPAVDAVELVEALREDSRVRHPIYLRGLLLTISSRSRISLISPKMIAMTGR